ncbi:MAG: sigma factor-like helix-turn-helix DNA-binding protein [Candidatus Acidiferrales bacterium]
MGDFVLPPPEPFWFVNSDLLEGLFRAELSLIQRLLVQHPELRNLLDTPVATVSDRKTCFTVLAHRKALEIISDMFAARYEQPSLSDEESNAASATSDLVPGDAPDWVLEIDRVVEQLPTHLFDALPQALRTARFNQNNAAQMEAIRTLNTIEQLKMLIEAIFDQQLGRLEKRWSAAIVQVPEPDELEASKRRLKGLEGLGPKETDLSRYAKYMDNLTEKQRLAFSMKFEYGLGLTQIASRMGIDRKTADEHIKAAQKKVEQARSNEKREARRSKNPPEF